MNLNQPPDLTNPAVVAEQCEMLSGAMRQQRMAATAGTAMSGHPYPEQMFDRAERVFAAAAQMLHVAAGRPVVVSQPPAEEAEPAPLPRPAPPTQEVIGGRRR